MARIAQRDLTRQQQLARGPIDLPFLGLVVLLLAIGLIMLLSASSYYAAQSAEYNNDGAYFFKRQAAFAVIGLVAMYFTSCFDYRRLFGFAGPIMLVSLVLLVAVFIPGVGVSLNNATRWIRLGVQFQPSEVAKIAVVIYFSARMCRWRDFSAERRLRYRQPMQLMRKFCYSSDLCHFWRPVAMLVVVVFLLYKQPHLSAIILVCFAAGAILFASGVKLPWFLAGIAAVSGYELFVLEVIGYNGDRLKTWLDPWWDKTDKSFQVLQSLYAVASGGLSGLGLGMSREKYLYLPEPENDVIFSVVCEELGFIGAVLIIALFALMIMRGYWLAIHARDRFGSLLLVGITTLMAVQVFLNIAVVINLIPATGISLPFFSYGGTALVIQLVGVGIVLSVSRQIPAAAEAQPSPDEETDL